MIKSYCYLSLPVAATFLSLLFVELLASDKLVKAQIPANSGAHQDAVRGSRQCTLLESGLCMEDSISEQIAALKSADSLKYKDAQDELEEDPMLAQMPTVDFKAYRRADISSFYQELPGDRTEMEPSFQGQAGKFVNLSPYPLELNWYGRNP